MSAKELAAKTPPDLLDRLSLFPGKVGRATESLTGMVLGQYQVLEELGRGGYGRVYKAQHALMNRLVALKLIAPHLVDDDKVRSWFRREVIACTQLTHPNIVMAYDADEIDNLLFLVMEYVDGPNLADQIARHGPLPLANAYHFLHQAALGLQFAHERGMVHRDIKPENLLLPRSTATDVNPIVVKITDFGLARLHPQSTPNNHTILHEVGGLGTPAFIAPEQAENIHAADIRSDLYSLGCTFYYALSGVLPFPGSTGMEFLAQHLKREARPLQALRPDIPAALAGIIRRLMEKSPDKRFQIPAELASELSFLMGPGAEWSTVPAPEFVNKLEENFDGAAATPLSATPSPATAPGQDQGEAKQSPQCPGASTAHATLPDSHWRVRWQQWYLLVQSMARGEKPRVHEANYQMVQRELLRASRDQAALTTGLARDQFLRLVALVEPWLNPQSLAALDRKNLASLFESCQSFNRELGFRSASRHLGRFVLLLASVFGAFVLAYWALAHGITRFWEIFR